MNLKSIKLVILLLLSTTLFSACSDDENIPLTDTSFDIISDLPVEDSAEQEDKLNEDDNNLNINSDSQNLDNDIDHTKYTEIPAESCSISGGRVSNAKVDIGYDSNYVTRNYYGYTNQYGQLFHVDAKEIILQDDDKEINGEDRYCNDEAKVPGTEEADLDEGHVIADSLGGTSNAYNITPQESYLNRQGTQADIEKEIRNAGGATDFIANIEYPNTQTQIPSSYTLSYTIYGQKKSHTFSNEHSKSADSVASNNDTLASTNEPTSNSDVYYKNCNAVRDANADPIYTGDPGYDSHLDRDGDGVGCE